MLSCFQNHLHQLLKKWRYLILQRKGPEQLGDAPRSLLVITPAHQAGHPGSTALFSHAPTEHISSSVKHICERIFGSQLFERQVPFFTCHLFSLAPLCLWSLFWEHQQQWELSEKDEEKNGQNLLPVIKSHSGMNFRIGILFTKNNRCPPVLLRWNFPLREM